MYASGDLVRWRAEGVLEYVGRVDGQIKVRGFRVEVEEIESVLSRHPAVREAAVLLSRRYTRQQETCGLCCRISEGFDQGKRAAQTPGSTAAALHGAGDICCPGVTAQEQKRQS